MTARYKVGDPVWARCTRDCDAHAYGLSLGEHAATLTEQCAQYADSWHLDIQLAGTPVCAPEGFLRPRRDDYQQHEPRVRREDLGNITNVPIEELVS